jgi:hypothetical protein
MERDNENESRRIIGGPTARSHLVLGLEGNLMAENEVQQTLTAAPTQKRHFAAEGTEVTA